MRKYLIIATILLLASACSKHQPAVSTTQNPPPQNQTTSTPPNTTAGWNSNITPAKYGFSIKYPNDFGFNTDIGQIAGMNIEACNGTDLISGTFDGCAFYIGNDYKDTNFDAAAVSVRVDSSLNTEAQCYNFNSQYFEAQTGVPDVSLNGVVFKSATGGGGAAGTSDKLQVYRNLHNGSCYEIDQSVFQSDINPIGNPPKNVSQFDETAVWQKLQAVVSTFEFVGTQKPVYTPDQLSIKYTNSQYGFVFSLPVDWTGFSIKQTSWSEASPDNSGNQTPVSGPQIDIINPKNTLKNPYEAIPIMVFTLQQWDEIENGTLVSAAPLPPLEFDRNSNYVFALPPRFDYDFNTGYQQAENIVASSPLKAY